MKTAFLICGLCLLSHLLPAQEVTLKGGWALPTGSYSNSNIQKSGDGFAQSGGFAALQMQYPLAKQFGLGLQLGYSTQRFNHTAYAEQLNQYSSGPAYTIASASPYKSTYGLIGCYFKLPKGKCEFNLNVGAGFLNLQTPSYNTTASYPSNSGTILTESENAMGGAFNWGLDLAYKLPHHFKLHAGLENLISTVDVSTSGYTSSTTNTKSLRVENYMIGLGLSYSLN